MSVDRRIEYLPLEGLAPDPRNPKNHDLVTLDQSVGRFGFVEPIVLDGRTQFILSGHGRVETLRAMQRRGEQPPEGIRLDKEGAWLAPVATGWSSRTDAEAAAALIAMNRTTELGGWVDESLLSLLEELSELGEEGFVGVGYGPHDIEDLTRYLDDSAPDLDELADQWDGSGLAPREETYASISLKNEEVAGRWKEYRKAFDTDDDAIIALLPHPSFSDEDEDELEEDYSVSPASVASVTTSAE